jgi:hypothetical protein
MPTYLSTVDSYRTGARTLPRDHYRGTRLCAVSAAWDREYPRVLNTPTA